MFVRGYHLILWGSYALLFQNHSGLHVPEIEIKLREGKVCFGCDVAQCRFYSEIPVLGEGLWWGDQVISGEEVHDVGVDDRVLVKPDVSEEVA